METRMQKITFILNRLKNFAEQCPRGKRGRPLSSQNAGDLEKQGLSICEKQRKRDGETIYYKTSGQLAKEKEGKETNRAARKEAGLSVKGRISKINKEKLASIKDKFAKAIQALKEIKTKPKTKPKPEPKSAPTAPTAPKPEPKPEPKPAPTNDEIKEHRKKYKTIPLPMDDPKIDEKFRIRGLESNKYGEKVRNFSDWTSVKEKIKSDKPEKFVNIAVLGVTEKQDKINKDELENAYKKILEERPLLVSPELPDLYYEAKKNLPNLTIRQFKNTLRDLRQNEKIDFYQINSVVGDAEPEFAINTSMGTIYYVAFRPKEQIKKIEKKTSWLD